MWERLEEDFVENIADPQTTISHWKFRQQVLENERENEAKKKIDGERAEKVLVVKRKKKKKGFMIHVAFS